MRTLKFSASYISRVHTICAESAFLSALAIGLLLHYKKIVKNGVAGYPQEWWPSVSSTIGDWYPERNLFQILIALTAGPRFALVTCWYILTKSPDASLPNWVFVAGILRTISCGGWVYITSSDDSDVHDFLMMSYIVLNIPWMIGSILTTQNPITRKSRKLVAWSFFGVMPGMIFFYVRHKVHRIPGAYTYYSFFEWFLIFADVHFDSITKVDFEALEITLSSPGVDAVKARHKESLSQPPPVTSNGTRATQTTSNENRTEIKLKTPENNTATPLRPVFSFVADVYLSYVWWSIMSSVAITLFYFSVWELSISGSEAAFLTFLSPWILSVGFIETALATHQGRVTLHILSLSGLVAFASGKPMTRLLLVSFANVCATIGQAITWSSAKDAQRNGVVLALGLMISTTLKMMNHSNNPIWPILNSNTGGWNLVGLSLAALAVFEFGTRPNGTSSSEQSNGDTSKRDGGVQSGVCLGTLIFFLQYLLSSSGTPIAWSWTGFPVKGPVVGVHDSLVIIAMALGILIPTSPTLSPHLANPAYLSFGAASLYTMYRFSDWTGFAGALLYAMFLCSVTPTVIMNAASSELSRAKIFGIAGFVYILFTLADVWTVAYAFVPGGVYLRERTDLVLIAHMLCMTAGLSTSKLKSKLSPVIDRSDRSLSLLILSLVALCAVLSTSSNLSLQPPVPHRASDRLVTAGIWTVHFGIDLAGRDSQRRMRDLVKDMELDIFGLLETDLDRIVYGSRDLTKVIADDLGYYIDRGPGPNKHTWGAVLFSKFPIKRSTHHLLPSPHGELAPAISAVLDVWGSDLMVIVAHNGQEEDPVDRELQSRELARIMSEAYPMPTIFLGYVVTKPLAPPPAPYGILTDEGRMHDIDQDDLDRWCEYILYRGLYRTGYGRVSRSTITDTEMQIGKFVLPRHGLAVSSESKEDRYLRSYKEDLPRRWWFNDSYYGDGVTSGVRGHHWHVFGTPLYYKVPVDAKL